MRRLVFVILMLVVPIVAMAEPEQVINPIFVTGQVTIPLEVVSASFEITDTIYGQVTMIVLEVRQPDGSTKIHRIQTFPN